MSRGKFLRGGADKVALSPLELIYGLILSLGCIYEQFEVLMKSIQMGRHPEGLVKANKKWA